MENKKRGRKPKPAAAMRSEPLYLRFTPVERDLIERAAPQGEMTAWARKQLVAAAERELKKAKP